LAAGSERRTPVRAGIFTRETSTSASVGLEVILRRLRNLRLSEIPRMLGSVLRGPAQVRVRFDAG
jgi:hypothetical protein